MEPVLYDEVEDLFNSPGRPPKINLSGDGIFFRYRSTHYSIKPFSFSEDSGQLIGILGNNGSGKSTILKLISSQLRPREGNIYINGADLKKNQFRLKSAIAFISHEDLLFPELTVFENMYYHAQLTLGSLTDTEIRKRIWETLERFALQGSPYPEGREAITGYPISREFVSGLHWRCSEIRIFFSSMSL